MSDAATLIREARHKAGLSQSGLAKRLGVSQAVVEKLESPGSNPTVNRLDVVLWATGHRLVMRAPLRPRTVDENLIKAWLELSPPERLRGLETMYAEERRRALAARDSRQATPD